MNERIGGAFVKGRHFVVQTADRLGLEQVDEFIHHSGTGPQPPGRRQLHSRRAHTFLCIFRVTGSTMHPGQGALGV